MGTRSWRFLTRSDNCAAVFVTVPEIDVDDHELWCLACGAAGETAGAGNDRHRAALAERGVERCREIPKLAGRGVQDSEL